MLTDEEKVEAIMNYCWTKQDRIDYFVKPVIPPSPDQKDDPTHPLNSEEAMAEAVYRGERKEDLMRKIYSEYLRSDLWKARQGKPRNFDWIRFWDHPDLDEFLQVQYGLLLEEREND